MNRNRHRVVFNAARGQRMVVAESARSESGGASGDTAAPDSARALLAPLGDLDICKPSRLRNVALHPLTLSIALAFTLGLVFYTTAHAQIVADPSAPGNQRPTILQAGNGATVVNIQTPSAAGVSRNVYGRFDVDASGAILNNSRTNVQTQIGGWISGNPWVGAPARVILNEVNSSNPSYLNGPLEVAGQRAEVIVANPSGIRVGGGTFLNASGVTLTTGTPVMNSGHLDAFLVRGGTVHIEGLGLDTRTADTTTILARAVEVNAGLWAGHLKVVSGANEVSADASTVTATPGSAQGPAPQFALDVAAIGGMYAGKIHLIGTEAGLGINNAGRMSASSGDFVLQADGWLRNTGSVQAQGQLTLQATDVDNRAGGQISATTTVIQADNALSNRGLIDGQVTRIEAVAVNNLGTGRVYGDTLAIQADTLRNDTETVNGVRTDAVTHTTLPVGRRGEPLKPPLVQFGVLVGTKEQPPESFFVLNTETGELTDGLFTVPY